MLDIIENQKCQLKVKAICTFQILLSYSN